MFSTTNLFKSIPCPEAERCQLPNCIYGFHPEALAKVAAPAVTQVQQITQHVEGVTTEPPAKRRKVTYDRLEDKPPSRAEQIKAQLAAERGSKKAVEQTKTKPISSLDRAITPPVREQVLPKPLQDSSEGQPEQAGSPWKAFKVRAKSKAESLNPRVLHPAPDSHAKRVTYLQHIHKNLVRLNGELKANTQPFDGIPANKYVMSDAELTTFALDEEEKVGKDRPKIYPNSIRSLLASLQKMKLHDWVEKLNRMDFAVDFTPGKAIAPVIVPVKGLPTGKEHLILPHLVFSDQESLKPYGYIPQPPSEAQIAQAQESAHASGDYEECDRCGARFEVFPDRNPETGRLTSNGPCRYHWARKIFPSKQKTDSYTGSNEAIYPCCGQTVGSEGCTKHDDHVFKLSTAPRLAAVVPFISTPENTSPLSCDGKPVHAVVFDCEMGYTTNGMELLRLSGVSWPELQPLVDILVRPRGTVIDLNTRFSGVKPEDMTTAKPYVEGGAKICSPGNLIIVDGTQTARQLLLDYLTPDTPLLGHAIDNDLNATRLCHPSIVDTVLLFQHPRGLPLRYGLKMLSKKYLNRDIQMGGSAGHDSKEDAIATGDLVKVKAADVWESMVAKGWAIDQKGLHRPASDQTKIGWQLSDRKIAKPKSAVGNGLARIIEDARSNTALTTAYLES